MSLTERDDTAQALAADGANEALGEGIEVRASGRQPDAADASRAEQLGEILSKHRIAIVNQKARVLQKAIDRIEQGAHRVLDPRVMQVMGDACDFDGAVI